MYWIKIRWCSERCRPQVELNCPAISIPEKITVDLEGLNVGHTIHISAIELPDGCTPT